VTVWEPVAFLYVCIEPAEVVVAAVPVVMSDVMYIDVVI
jgi:hypothetical protein